MNTPHLNNKSKCLVSLALITALFAVVNACNSPQPPAAPLASKVVDTAAFTAPDTATIPRDKFGDLVRYGRELVINTAYYLGPNGTVGHYLGNKMNCAHCHIDAGTRPFAFNFLSSYARYPQYRGRENEVLDIPQRINNCIERPHSGTPLPLGSKEIIAIECYIRWVGSKVPIGSHVKGDENLELEMPDRAADPQRGAAIYATNCASCHGANGQGQWNADSSTYRGPESYQRGSSPSRVLKLAGFIKANMPDKLASWEKPFLTDEQAIDVAAFINDDKIHPRPMKKNRAIPDYPDMNSKAIDYDEGPFPDSFSAFQHKFGPYKPIIEYHKKHNLSTAL